METEAERNQKPLEEWEYQSRRLRSLSHAETILLPIVVTVCEEFGERAFKADIREQAYAAGLPKQGYERAIQDLVDRGAMSEGWYNGGTRGEPDL